jgi:cytochrome c oxidase assembly factor CtaG
MWTAWVLAYMLAMSNGNWYPGYVHTPGLGVSLVADQQLAAGVIWALATFSFVPVIFWNLVQWLRTDEDADHELNRLVHEERRRALPPRPTSRPG